MEKENRFERMVRRINDKTVGNKVNERRERGSVGKQTIGGRIKRVIRRNLVNE